MIDDVYDLALLRRAVYGLLVLSTLVHVSARILTVQSRDRHTPFLSANDRSRWSTISALVDYGTYEIDRVRLRPGWKSIDMVRHGGDDGELHYYSSKPPLLPTLIAPLYAAIRFVTGMSFAEHPFAVARTILLIVNLLPLAAYLLLFAWWVERHGETDFGRIFVVACACWATFLTPFASSLNNHLPAAICVLVSSLCLWRVWYAESPSLGWFAIGGLAAALAAANELPALAFLVLVSATLLWLHPRQTLAVFLPAVAVVAAGFFITNYVAHDSWRPPYAHRAVGENWYDYPGSYWIEGRQGVDRGEPSRLRYLVHILVGHHGFFSLTPVWLASLCGIAYWVARGDWRRRYFALLAIGLLVVCVLFYVGLRPLEDRNYGGVASGFRWLFWLIPLWLLVMVPAADWMAERQSGRILAFALLGVSMLSATYPAANPWSHPWLYQIASRSRERPAAGRAPGARTFHRTRLSAGQRLEVLQETQCHRVKHLLQPFEVAVFALHQDDRAPTELRAVQHLSGNDQIEAVEPQLNTAESIFTQRPLDGLQLNVLVLPANQIRDSLDQVVDRFALERRGPKGTLRTVYGHRSRPAAMVVVDQLPVFRVEKMKPEFVTFCRHPLMVTARRS